MEYFHINDKKIKQRIFVSLLNTIVCLVIVFWLCSGALFEPDDTVWQKVFMVGLFLTVILMLLWYALFFVLFGMKEFFMLGLKIGFEENGIVILKKDCKHKISMSDLIAICDDGISFRISFYYQGKLFALEVIKKCFSPSLIETMKETFSPLACFTKSSSTFKGVCKEHEAKFSSRMSSFEIWLGK